MVDVNSLNKEERFALLFGILAGDGCLSKHVNKKGRKYYFISISGNYYDDKPFYNSVVVPLINLLREKHKKQISFKERLNQGKIEINFSDKILFDKLRNIGFPIGKKGQKLTIPEYFFDKNLLEYIIQGFFATDGSLVLTKNPNKFYPRIEAVVIHKNFLKQIYNFLVLIGLNGSYYKSKSKPDPRWEVTQDKYRFQFNGKKNLLLFNELIGFINPKHKKKFLDFIDYEAEYSSTLKGIPFSKHKEIRESLNALFQSRMAALGVEPRTPSS